MALPSTRSFNVKTDTGLPTTAASERLDRIVTEISKALSWLWAAVIVVIAVTILVRYGAARFNIQTDDYLLKRLVSSVFWEELTWYLYGYAWLVGMSYVIVVDEHVRVDLIHERLSRSKQVWIEILGVLFMLIPMILVILIHGLDFGLSSFRDGEGSQQIGLDFVWVIKFAIPLTMIVTLMAAVSRLIKCFRWIQLNKENRFHPPLISIQVIALLYNAGIIYLMYAWSQTMAPMVFFQIFGF